MKKILIVDDDSSIVDVLTIILSDDGHEVISTTEGKEALALAEKKPDLILLDILMSGSDGRDICRKLKKNPKTKNIPVLIISAQKRTKEIAKEVGANDFISKPFEMNELSEKVRTLLN